MPCVKIPLRASPSEIGAVNFKADSQSVKPNRNFGGEKQATSVVHDVGGVGDTRGCVRFGPTVQGLLCGKLLS